MQNRNGCRAGNNKNPPHETQQPNTSNTNIPNPHTTLSPQTQVGDWVNNGQVMLNTGQCMKEIFYGPEAEENIENRCGHNWEVGAYTNTVQQTTQDCNHFHENHVVGEDVGVTSCCCCRGDVALLPPSLVPQIEHKSGERKDEKDVGDGEDCED